MSAVNEETYLETPAWAASESVLGISDSRPVRELQCTSLDAKMSGTRIVNNEKKLKRNHTLYIIQISIGSNSWTVERTFDDFLYLHQQIVKYFSISGGHVNAVPEMPARRISERLFGGSSTKIHVNEERQHKLELYLQTLIKLNQSWDGTDLVKFLDNTEYSLMFIWNVDRMRKVQSVSTVAMYRVLIDIFAQIGNRPPNNPQNSSPSLLSNGHFIT